jgi:hypothetical protein
MTEAEWLECDNPYQMLIDLHTQWYEKRVGEPRRSLWLFGCACCRRIWHYLEDDRGKIAIEVMERYADGLATAEELKRAGDAVEAAFCGATEAARREATSEQEFVQFTGVPSYQAIEATALAVGRNPGRILPRWNWYGRAMLVADTSRLAVLMAAGEVGKEPKPNTHAEVRAQHTLLRDCLGNPFRPFTPDPALRRWNDSTIPRIAQAIYDDRAFDRLPILADALEEAGCTDAGILAHCRGAGPHVRGCWTIDLLLGNV